MSTHAQPRLRGERRPRSSRQGHACSSAYTSRSLPRPRPVTLDLERAARRSTSMASGGVSGLLVVDAQLAGAKHRGAFDPEAGGCASPASSGGSSAGGVMIVLHESTPSAPSSGLSSSLGPIACRNKMRSSPGRSGAGHADCAAALTLPRRHRPVHRGGGTACAARHRAASRSAPCRRWYGAAWRRCTRARSLRAFGRRGT